MKRLTALLTALLLAVLLVSGAAEPADTPEPEKAGPGEITRQIELNLSKILDGSANAPASSDDVSGDTMVMKPLG